MSERAIDLSILPVGVEEEGVAHDLECGEENLSVLFEVLLFIEDIVEVCDLIHETGVLEFDFDFDVIEVRSLRFLPRSQHLWEGSIDELADVLAWNDAEPLLLQLLRDITEEEGYLIASTGVVKESTGDVWNVRL